MAMIKLTNDPEWKSIGGRFLVPVHDELIVEVPYENREKGAEVLSRCMVDAGSFLPFAISCDVEQTFRWYGLSVDSIESFDKPNTLDKNLLSESNISWLQCMLFENEYILPIFNNEDGSKPIGDAAHGINGRWSDDMDTFIADYKKRYSIHDDIQFIDHIDRKVRFGAIQ